MVETDASNGVVAGVLSQQDPSTQLWYPVAFYSKTMVAAELNYDIHDKEMLAIIRALEEWRAELEGLQATKPFLVYSDHRALEYFMTTKKLSARQARWAEFLSRYDFRLMYRTGKSNERADALSRRTEAVAPQKEAISRYRTQILLPYSQIDAQVIEDLQLAVLDKSYDSVQLVEKILKTNRTSPDLEDLRKKATLGDRQDPADKTWQIRDKLLLRHGKLYVTNDMLTDQMPLRTAIIREAHDQPLSGHPGRTKLRHLLQSRYYWPNQGKDIDQYYSNCYTCRRAHVSKDKKPGFLYPLLVLDRPWQYVIVDFKKCLTRKARNNIIAIFVNRLSKRPIIILVKDTIKAKELALLFLIYVI